VISLLFIGFTVNEAFKKPIYVDTMINLKDVTSSYTTDYFIFGQ